MKVLILATPRSGSSILLDAFRRGNDLRWFSEPFNYELHKSWDGNKENFDIYSPINTNVFYIPNDIAIKCLTWFNHWPHDEKKYWNNGGYEAYYKYYCSEIYHKKKLSFFLRYIRVFDRVILLLRRDVGDQLKSILIADEVNKDSKNPLFWGSEYKDRDPVFNEKSSHTTRFFFDSIWLIEALHRIKGIPIIYYEDLFTDNRDYFMYKVSNYELGIEKYWESHFHPSKRYRKK